MKHKIFCFLWYKIIIKLIPVGKDKNGFIRNHKRINAQLYLAGIFGTIKCILLGDSEHGQFDKYDVMKEFDDLTVNLSISGTTPLDLYNYFMTTGKDIYQKVKLHSATKFISTGGNCSLRNLMIEVPESMINVHNMLPESIIILIPPVYTGILAKLYNMVKIDKPESQIVSEINIVRNFQRSIWSPCVLDTYTPFVDPQTGLPLLGVLKDPVHFGRQVVDLIQKVYKSIT